MKLNLALNIMMGSLITKSIVYGQEKALQTRSLSTMEEVVGAGCRNSINFYGHTKTKDGSKCVKSTLCEASHTNAMFVPQARDTCVQFSDDEPECSLFEVVTSFEEGWSLQHLTMKPSKMDPSLDPKSVRFLASKDKLVWKELLSSEIAFQNREDRIAFVLRNDETYHHYALQFEKSKDTLYVGKVGLVESYTASCTADLHYKITGVSHEFADGNELKTAVDQWLTNKSKAMIRYGHIGHWKVGKVKSMKDLFKGKHDDNKCAVFNEDLSLWDTSQVTNMVDLFRFCIKFNSNISTWNVAKATDMTGMFLATGAFNQDISAWNISSVTDLKHMFNGAGAFNQDLSSWNIAKVIYTHHMFAYSKAFTKVLCWDMSKVKASHSMFYDAKGGRVNQNC